MAVGSRPTMTLHATINELAERFAHDLLRALRGASLDEIIAETAPGYHGVKRRRGAQGLVASSGGKRGRLARRSEKDLAKIAEEIVATVKASGKTGINAETLRGKLGIQRKELPRPLGMALTSKKITKRGKKRATTYYGA